jgi:murein DD-endopeptidase MepM/ murein hydrolase activator NlpD
MPRRRAVTVVLQPDGAEASRTFRVPLWLVRVGTVGAVAFLVLAVAVLALYGPLVSTALRVPSLERQIERLQAENAKVRELVAALDSAQSRYEQVRQMIGGDIVRDAVALTGVLPVAPPIRAEPPGAIPRYTGGPGVPQHWPLDAAGYLTRGQGREAAPGEAHPGIDIAVPVGSVVRAAAGGTVFEVGDDPEYGRFVLLEHPSDYRTMYGHLSRQIVRAKQVVGPGEVLGLTGNSGRSTAPHLHFEVRHLGKSVDPLTLVKENR